MQCSAVPCPAPATVLLTGRGGAGGVHRAATTCDTHRRETRRWVAGAGPNVTEQALQPDPDEAPVTLF
ncbi:hypothetical protein E1264_28465 [Actinomadura sp. KC216]|uniref:hypothetical protein n=1 Tax=Actinomadura sp. KC216 TaxID=2530370 RepID=UPI001045136C|nr:hypothetical protein [Actinomadura sp. KC216]TDB83415.1 hypothetical protein E1264_28465 [Actinomadura sp. KC216]